MWVSEPTWANHIPLLGGAGLNLEPYPYYDTDNTRIRSTRCWTRCASCRQAISSCLHACCHNPSGLDPTEDEWRAIADVIVERDLVPFVDMAYQGFAASLNDDAFVIRHLADACRR